MMLQSNIIRGGVGGVVCLVPFFYSSHSGLFHYPCSCKWKLSHQSLPERFVYYVRLIGVGVKYLSKITEYESITTRLSFCLLFIWVFFSTTCPFVKFVELILIMKVSLLFCSTVVKTFVCFTCIRIFLYWVVWLDSFIFHTYYNIGEFFTFDSNFVYVFHLWSGSLFTQDGSKYLCLVFL